MPKGCLHVCLKQVFEVTRKEKWEHAIPMALVCAATFVAGFVNAICLSIMQDDPFINFTNSAIGIWLFVAVLPWLIVLCGRRCVTAVAYILALGAFSAYTALDAYTWEAPEDERNGAHVFCGGFGKDSMYDAEDNDLVLTLLAFDEACDKTYASGEISKVLLEIAKIPEDERKKRGDSLLLHVDTPDPLAPMLEPLKHLRVKEGWTLDCRVEGSADSAAKAKFCMRRGDETADVEYVLDGTPESAWERVLMDFAETQFFLVWHACAAERSIVTSAKRFKFEARTMEGGAKTWNSFSPLTRLRLRWKDLRPSVSVEDGVATVSFCRFSPFHGLVRICCRVDLKTGEIKTEDYEMLAHYNCGVIF